MKYIEVVKAVREGQMKKQASVKKLAGMLKKKAADGKVAATSPAGVGGYHTYPEPAYENPKASFGQMDMPNTYQTQLLKNYGITDFANLGKAFRLNGGYGGQINGKFMSKYIFPALPSVYNKNTGKIMPKRVALGGKGIQQGDLQSSRRLQAALISNRLFDKHTDQHPAAEKYLIQRGAQNQKRFREGTLEKNAPTEVKMPANIPESKRQELDQLGKLMVQSKRPSYNQQLYS